MFELPEYLTLARQLNETVMGKTIQDGQLGNSPHKFVWYNRTHQEFNELTRGKVVGEAYAKGRWLFVPLRPAYVLLLGECGGKLLFHSAGAQVPKKYHLIITFSDDTFLTATTRMWGAMELYDQGQEQERAYVKGMRVTPVDPGFTLEYLTGLIETAAAEKRRSAKGLLTQDQLIPGLGNAIAQDILFKAHLSPKHPIDALDAQQIGALYHAIVHTVHEIIDQGGRYDEYDLYNQQGGYVRLMDKNAVGRPCPECGGSINKISYLGGTCYFCLQCQP